MADIVLSTLNARWIHSAFGLRYLMANLGPLEHRARIIEFEIASPPPQAAERILAEDPLIVGLGVYIWNLEATTRLVEVLRTVRPGLKIVLGGPEVSHEAEDLRIVDLADHVVRGEGEIAFRRLCEGILEGGEPPAKFVEGGLPDLTRLERPYRLYTDTDLAHRVVYVEASRGCPFTCEFCLSSLDTAVRPFPVEPFLEDLGRLVDRGARTFKFVDRTFNLNLRIAGRILDYFQAREEPVFLHFEMIPDRFPEALRDRVRAFDPGTLQFEVGIQSFEDSVNDRILRRQDTARAEENLRFLRDETGVHVHADLIVGLPGEDLECFARGFDRLVALGPDEIQIGFLKRLRGTSLGRHATTHGLRFAPHPPYEVLATDTLPFSQVRHMKRFARYWDLVANSGNFRATLPRILSTDPRGPFASFSAFSTWLYEVSGSTHQISLTRLSRWVFEFLTARADARIDEIARDLWADYTRGGRSDRPVYLRGFDLPPPRNSRGPAPPLPRQARHVGSRP